MKERGRDAAAELAPARKRARGPARVDFVRAVARAHDARLAAGACAAVGRAVCVEQRDRLPRALHRQRRPRAEDARADDDGVVSLLHYSLTQESLCDLCDYFASFD